MEALNVLFVSNPMDISSGLLMLVALAYAIGDIVSYKTKAIFSMVFVTGLILLLSFWGGLPKNLFSGDAGRTYLQPFAVMVMPFVLVHMGSLMKIRDLINEWKTVTVAFVGLVSLSIGLYFIGGALVGQVQALTAAGPISGGIVATLIVREAAEAKGFASLAVFASLLLVLQNFVGLPIASLCLKSEGRRLKKIFTDSGGKVEVLETAKSDPETPSIQLFPKTPKELQTPFILLFKVFIVGYLALWFAEVTGGVVHKFVMGLIFGIIFYEIGFLEHNIYTKANAAGFTMFLCIIPVFTGLPNATPQMVQELMVPVAICFSIAVVSVAISSFILGKILGYSWGLAMAISVTCLFGFPATFIVSDEVTTSLAESPEQKAYLMSHILPKMLVGGFTTVTIGSVVLAGYLAKVILSTV